MYFLVPQGNYNKIILINAFFMPIKKYKINKAK